jgi:hypothetical protein
MMTEYALTLLLILATLIFWIGTRENPKGKWGEQIERPTLNYHE